MKKLTVLIVGALLIFACGTNDLPDVTADLEALKSFNLEIEKVWNEGDYEGYMSLIDDEAVFKGYGMAPVVGIEALRTLYKESFDNFTVKLKTTSEEIFVFGDYAYSLETWKGSMNPKDGSTPIVFDNTAVGIYKKQADNTWKLWRAIYNANVPANE